VGSGNDSLFLPDIGRIGVEDYYLGAGLRSHGGQIRNVDHFETRIALDLRKQFTDAKGMGRCAQTEARNQNRRNYRYFLHRLKRRPRESGSTLMVSQMQP
jgi:hypothetical protein